MIVASISAAECFTYHICIQIIMKQLKVSVMSLSSLLIIFSSSFMALFPVINPLGNGFVVNGFFANLDPSQRKTAIQKLTINFIMIGVGTLLIGHLFLLIFGLAIPVIQLGGGILICKTAIEPVG